MTVWERMLNLIVVNLAPGCKKEHIKNNKYTWPETQKAKKQQVRLVECTIGENYIEP